MSEGFSEELKKELVKQAVKNLEDPFKMLTVKDVAKDLYMGENKTNEIFNREDFPSVNIGKTRKIRGYRSLSKQAKKEYAKKKANASSFGWDNEEEM